MTPPRDTARPVRTTARLCAAALCLGASACGLDAGERFGRAGSEPDVVRIHVLDDVRELDPARARTPLERALSRQLFAALVEPDVTATAATSAPRLGLATSWFLDDGRLHLELRRDARFSDGTPVDAPSIVWSWRRALRPSTGTADARALAVVARGTELMRFELLRVGPRGGRARPPPFATFRDESGPESAPASGVAPTVVELAPGTAVRVVDTNARVPCCGQAVALFRAPRPDAPSSGALLPGDVGVIIAVRDVDGQSMLQLRGPDGSAGWCRASDVKQTIPTVGLATVVDRGARPALRAGPDDAAPVRAQLVDEDTVEVLERGPDFSLVIDPKTGKSGWIASHALQDTSGERRWLLVESLDDGRRGWLAEQDLAFDPSLLDAVALDEHTLVVGIDPDVDVDRALLAFAEPVMRPVPARFVEERGHSWMDAANAPTSGPFAVTLRGRRGITLTRVATSFEASRALVDRVELERVENRTTALHLYRAGLLDVVLDGALPADLAGTLARATDFVPGPNGGALVAPEVRGGGVRAGVLELRDVEVRP